MQKQKSDRFLAYLEEQIREYRREEERLNREERRDEANHIRIRSNIFEIFQTVYGTIAGREGITESEIAVLFREKLSQIPLNWRQSWEMAKLHEDVEKQLVEEMKLEALAEIEGKFTQLWEEKHEGSGCN